MREIIEYVLVDLDQCTSGLLLIRQIFRALQFRRYRKYCVICCADQYNNVDVSKLLAADCS